VNGVTALSRRVAVILLLALGSIVPATAYAAPTPHPRDPAAQAYGGCLRGQKGGDLLLLIDESASLQRTDKQHARVNAATYLLNQLSALTNRAKIDLNVAVAGFADTYELTRDWTPLTQQSVLGLTDDVAAYGKRDQGISTDYWMALDGARTTLQNRPATATGARRCQAIAWFTDGEQDIEARADDAFGTKKPYAGDVRITTPEAARQATGLAETAICRPGLLADQLRSAGVTTFAVGLAPAGQAPQDFSLLTSIATGTPNKEGPCGKIVQPTPGTFHLATNLDDLYFALDDIIEPDLTPSTGVCAAGQVSSCGDKHEFVLDDSIDAVHILGGTVDTSGTNAQLVGPDGKPVPLLPKTVGQTTRLDRDGVGLSWTWQSDQTVTVDMDQGSGAPASWSGVWDLVFVAPDGAPPTGSSRSNIHIYGDLAPAWLNKSDAPLQSGATVPGVQLGLAKPDGSRVEPTSLRGTVAVSASIVGQDGRSTVVASGLDKSSLDTPVRLDLRSVPPGPATLHLTLNLTTASAVRAEDGKTVPGTALVPQEVDLPLKIETPVGYPTLGGRVNFGTADGITDLTTTLPVTGPGCVWLGGPAAVVTAPDGVAVNIGTDGATSPSTCLPLKDGEMSALPLHLHADRTGNGTATGTLPVSIAPPGASGKAQVVQVAFTADLQKPFKTTNALIALLAALLLGPGIPLALLYLVKWLVARIPGRPLYAKRIPVTVEYGRLMRDGEPFALRGSDFVNLVAMGARGARRVDADGVPLVARTGWSPFGVGTVVVEVPGVAAASSEDPVPHGDRLAAHLPLAVHNKWVLLHDPAGHPDRAEVLVLLGADASSIQRDDLAARISGEAPELLTRLRKAALERTAGSRGGSGDPGQPEPVRPGPADGGYGPGGYGPAYRPQDDPAPAGPGSYGPAGYGPGSYGPGSYGPAPGSDGGGQTRSPNDFNS
jgi:hypothetical protein